MCLVLCVWPVPLGHVSFLGGKKMVDQDNHKVTGSQ